MLVEQARVISVSGDQVQLEVETAAGCHSCAQGKGCGAGKLAKAFTKSHSRLLITWAEPVEPGEQVELLLPESTLVSASLLIYLMPIAFLLGGAVFLEYLLGQLDIVSEPALILGSVLIAVGGWGLARVLVRRREYAGKDYIRLRRQGGVTSQRIPIHQLKD